MRFMEKRAKETAMALLACMALGMTACGGRDGAADALAGEPTAATAEPTAAPTAAPAATAEPTASPAATPAPTAAPAATAEPTASPTATPAPTPRPKPTLAPTVTEQGKDVPLGKHAPAETYSDRALIAVKADKGVFVSWRSYVADSEAISFTLSRNGSEIYRGALTSYLDTEGKPGDTYTLKSSEGISSNGESTKAWAAEYQEFTLVKPADQTMPDGSIARYSTEDMSVGDLDGDGQLELIVKWNPDNAQDNSIDGYTGTTMLDAYDIDVAEGTARLMWRIDLGLNIRSGAHYTQFQVWDYDGDGKAELICKTADGSTAYDADLKETGHVGAVSMAALDISQKGTPQGYDFRQHKGRLGRIVLGQEYLTAFDGETGRILDTVEYIPARGPYLEEKGIYDTTGWGLKGNSPAESNDGYANRADRFLAATGYFDEGSACAVFARGYYGRTAITAWKLNEGRLVLKWYFDTPTGSEYAAQGNHNLSVNDVDGDGFDEIIYGSLTMDHDGTPLYTTGLGHGDAMHVSDWNGDGKLEVFQVHEEKKAAYGLELHDAATGEILWGVFTGKDIGRGMAADIDPRYEGAEMWSTNNSDVYDCRGNVLPDVKRPSVNFSIFWDGDLLMELFDSNNSKELVPRVQKWDYNNGTLANILWADGALTNSNNKPGLLADIYGDWREEIIVHTSEDGGRIRIYSTTWETEHAVPCLLEDRAYREGVAWQNTAYNQPANLSYLLSGTSGRTE